MAGGHVDYVICDTGSATAMLQGKVARPLMIFEDKRDPRYADVPIQKDLGYNVDTLPSLRGVVGPPNVSHAKTVEDMALSCANFPAPFAICPL